MTPVCLLFTCHWWDIKVPRDNTAIGICTPPRDLLKPNTSFVPRHTLKKEAVSKINTGNDIMK